MGQQRTAPADEDAGRCGAAGNRPGTAVGWHLHIVWFVKKETQKKVPIKVKNYTYLFLHAVLGSLGASEQKCEEHLALNPIILTSTSTLIELAVTGTCGFF